MYNYLVKNNIVDKVKNASNQSPYPTFYDIKKIYPYLRKEHRQALNVIYPNRFNIRNKFSH